jgi:hypothetical protein
LRSSITGMATRASIHQRSSRGGCNRPAQTRTEPADATRTPSSAAESPRDLLLLRQNLHHDATLRTGRWVVSETAGREVTCALSHVAGRPPLPRILFVCEDQALSRNARISMVNFSLKTRYMALLFGVRRFASRKCSRQFLCDLFKPAGLKDDLRPCVVNDVASELLASMTKLASARLCETF